MGFAIEVYSGFIQKSLQKTYAEYMKASFGVVYGLYPTTKRKMELKIDGSGVGVSMGFVLKPHGSRLEDREVWGFDLGEGFCSPHRHKDSEKYTTSQITPLGRS